jgi:transcriptional regulator with XRE-family HTH domain
MLADIRPDYYLRLEQGRDHHPSPQVLDAIARALQLDEEATAHLHALSGPSKPRRDLEGAERGPASIVQLDRVVDQHAGPCLRALHGRVGSEHVGWET